MSSCASDALNAFKTVKFCSSFINICQLSNHARYWVCKDCNHGLPTLDSFFLIPYIIPPV